VTEQVRRIYCTAPSLAWLFSMFARVFCCGVLLMFFLLDKSLLKPPENLITEHYNQPSIALSIYYCNKCVHQIQNKSEVNLNEICFFIFFNNFIRKSNCFIVRKLGDLFPERRRKTRSQRNCRTIIAV